MAVLALVAPAAGSLPGNADPAVGDATPAPHHPDQGMQQLGDTAHQVELASTPRDARGLDQETSAGGDSGQVGAVPPAQPSNAATATGGDATDECVDPHPCGRHWPEDVQGPFEMKGDPLYVEIAVPRDWDDADDPDADTITLAGWVGLPDVGDVKVPVALSSTPYLGQGGSQWDPDDDEWWHEGATGLRVDNHWGVPPIELIKRGYAAAFFSVRGTGESGGCVDWFGPDEQKDQAAIVEWLAARPWSNGRVAMGGRSWMAGTAFEAAIEQTPSLKTVVVGALTTDLYTFVHSPQGAAHTAGPVNEGRLAPLYGVGNPQRPDAADTADRTCLDAEESPGWTVRGYATERRPADFYAARRLIDRFDDVRASVLLTHGLRDTTANDFQDDAAWRTLSNAPKRALLGYWAHELPAIWVDFDPSWQHNTWEEILFGWLDYWLKGIGEPDRLGKFDYQVGADIPWWPSLANNAPDFDPGSWTHDTTWPPRRAREEVLYLAGSGLRPDTGTGDRSFRSAPPTIFSSFRGADSVDVPVPFWPALCPDGVTDELAGVAYLGEPASKDLVIAGNPFAYLQLSSDQAGGLVGVHLLTVPAEIPCDPALSPPEAHTLAFGVADLRFHSGNLTGVDFPEQGDTVRIDLGSVSERVPAGRRLAVVVSYGEMDLYAPSGQYTPLITVHGGSGPEASQIVIPFVEGSMKGKRPKIDYPPRPFVP